jgi:hypothetical protein
MRSIGNAVGTHPFKNTNRTTAKYTRKADKKARRLGFVNAAHRALFTAMMVANHAKRQEAQ